MSLAALRAVAAVDATNVAALTALSPRHGAAAASGYVLAATATVLAHVDARHDRLARVLYLAGLVPNTVGAVLVARPSPRDRALSWYIGVGGAVLGGGYLWALRGR